MIEFINRLEVVLQVMSLVHDGRNRNKDDKLFREVQ